jgi:hypothetical protein
MGNLAKGAAVAGAGAGALYGGQRLHKHYKEVQRLREYENQPKRSAGTADPDIEKRKKGLLGKAVQKWKTAGKSADDKRSIVVPAKAPVDAPVDAPADGTNAQRYKKRRRR